MPTDHSAKNPAAASLAGRCVSFSPPQRLGLEVGWYFFHLFLSSPPPPLRSTFPVLCSLLTPLQRANSTPRGIRGFSRDWFVSLCFRLFCLPLRFSPPLHKPSLSSRRPARFSHFTRCWERTSGRLLSPKSILYLYGFAFYDARFFLPWLASVTVGWSCAMVGAEGKVIIHAAPTYVCTSDRVFLAVPYP